MIRRNCSGAILNTSESSATHACTTAARPVSVDGSPINCPGPGRTTSLMSPSSYWQILTAPETTTKKSIARSPSSNKMSPGANATPSCRMLEPADLLRRELRLNLSWQGGIDAHELAPWRRNRPKPGSRRFQAGSQTLPSVITTDRLARRDDRVELFYGCWLQLAQPSGRASQRCDRPSSRVRHGRRSRRKAPRSRRWTSNGAGLACNMEGSRELTKG